MRLQLTPNQITDMGARLGPFTEMSLFVNSVLNLFQEEGHDPFTRRDITALIREACKDLGEVALEDISYDYSELLNPKVEGKRGYYTFADSTMPAEAPSEPPEAPTATEPDSTPAVALAPMPTAPEAAPWRPAVDTESYYAEDLGLRRLAAEQTKCFGTFWESDPKCEVCPLAAFCAPLALAQLAEIAATLNRDTHRALAKGSTSKEAKAAAKAAAKKEAKKEAKRGGVGEGEVRYQDGVHFTETPFPGLCTKCRKGIEEGERAAHVPGVGMLHEPCARI